ncbi:MAG: aminoacyl-tRNA hydrolase [Gammaproteobacteria bacterium]|nr:aminoacyl-tRNA hydrolase [Gammaproteobacteria bacterium]MDP2142312.1 aminoacyl-tRNA hydrolase [Gammaproteobacteria bacterium]MDP2348553.1 aminoacyl-tRNA hydrolase [Gammaproteobacteria bacterium]
MQGNELKLIVGLGNPGPQYRHNRHNVGAWLVSRLAKDANSELRNESKFFGETGRITLAGADVRLLFPTTFMNRSGQSVAAFCNYFDIAPENMLVAYDEIDFDVGTTRYKHGGGHGGHNGIRDIISALGDKRDFYRLRIGVGHPGNKALVANYVLSDPSRTETEIIDADIDLAIRTLPHAVRGNWQTAMHELHTKPV